MDIQRAGGDGGSTLPGAVPYVRILRACPLDADRIFLSAAGRGAGGAPVFAG